MPHIDTTDLTVQVLNNCALSDAGHAGTYSICGLALRLRDLYKWQNHLQPWVEDDPNKVLGWIGDKEEIWEKIEGGAFEDIVIANRRYDPFDSKAINTTIADSGLFYGAGYARNLKPTFFLAKLEKTIRVDGYPVHILGRELARDLATLPALSQDDKIIIRKDAGKYYFWDQLFFINPSGKKALAFGLKKHGLDPEDTDLLKENLARLFKDQMDIYIYHELGEMNDAIFDTGQWREIIAAFAGSPIELLARAAKDLLADTGDKGLLKHVIAQGKEISLAFYVAFIDGLRKELFPEIRIAFAEFTQSHQWDVITRAVKAGQTRARDTADELNRIFQEGKAKNDMKWAEKEIKKCLLSPIGLKN